MLQAQVQLIKPIVNPHGLKHDAMEVLCYTEMQIKPFKLTGKGILFINQLQLLYVWGNQNYSTLHFRKNQNPKDLQNVLFIILNFHSAQSVHTLNVFGS